MPSNSAKPTLIFHIGHHKTGSTSIQEALASGRLQVEGRKLLYPTTFNHNYLPRHFETFLKTGRSPRGDAARPGLPVIARQLEAGGFDHAVLSGEVFESFDPARARQVLDRFMLPHVADHAVICYLRPHAARLLSSYAEQIKLGRFQGTADEFHARFVEKGKLAYMQAMSGWGAAFGAHFHVRPMVRDRLEDGSVVRDFARLAFGPDAVIRFDDVGSANESLCLEDLLLVGHVQQALMRFDVKLRHSMGWALALAMNARRRTGLSTRLALHRSLAEDIRQTCLADAQALDAGLFVDMPVMVRELDRAVDTALDRPLSLELTDYFSADELRDFSILTDVLARLVEVDPAAAQSLLLNERIADMQAGPDTTPDNRQRETGHKVGKKKRAIGGQAVDRRAIRTPLPG